MCKPDDHSVLLETPLSTEQPNENSKMSSWKVFCYAGGILVSFAVFGIFQEKILRGRYGEKGERFNFQFSLLLMQCVANALTAKILLSTVLPQGRDLTGVKYYIVCSAFYLGAMLSSFTALQYVNYPTQVVAKSCKPIPVMILGVLLARKRYPLRKYLFVLSIVIGVALFMYKDGVDSKAVEGWSGNILLILSLMADGLTGVAQERMRFAHQTKSLHMMFKVNLWALLYICLGLLYTGELPRFFEFLTRFPQLYMEIGLFAVCSAVGQIFIYSTVAEFGPLVCSIVTTTRKFFTVLISIMWFGNSLTDRQWMGTVFVFAGLFLDALYGKAAPASKVA